MRNIKPYSQWFLQTPILFCSGSLVYFGWPYLALLVKGCLSVLAFISTSNIIIANVRQALADKGHSKDEVVMFSEQIKPLVLECENLSAILSTHDDALDTLTHSFKELQDVNMALHHTLLKSKVGSEVTLELHDNVKRLETAVTNSIRGLQFADINGQHLIYTKDTLVFLIGQLQIINAQNSNDISQFLKKQPEIIRNRQQKVTNPVSSLSSSMSSGEVELF
jgi:methyl-accepting chemotaxis protein